MRNGNCCITDVSHSLEKMKNIRSIPPDNAVLVTADVGGLYPKMPNKGPEKRPGIFICTLVRVT